MGQTVDPSNHFRVVSMAGHLPESSAPTNHSESFVLLCNTLPAFEDYRLLHSADGQLEMIRTSF